MKTSTSQRRNGIQWTLCRQLDDLEYTDDLAHLSLTRHKMQENTSAVETPGYVWALISIRERKKS